MKHIGDIIKKLSKEEKYKGIKSTELNKYSLDNFLKSFDIFSYLGSISL
jgi:hypothetical protein